VRFLLPDPVLQVPEAERRATMWKAPSEKPDLLQVDGVGAFVCALLPIHIEGGDSLTYGTWLAVDPAQLKHIHATWWSPEYSQLVVDGYLANAVPPWDEALLAAPAHAVVRDPRQVPYIESSTHPLLDRVLGELWPPGAVSAAPKLGGDPLAPTAEGMRERVADGRKHFRAALERVTGEGLERPTASGWTRKQMLAHIGAWHLITAERLRRACEDRRYPPPPDDEDAVNADAATTASDLAASTVLRDLDASFETLWQELASLDDTMVQANDGWAEAIVMGNTSAHYAEHLGELQDASATA